MSLCILRHLPVNYHFPRDGNLDCIYFPFSFYYLLVVFAGPSLLMEGGLLYGPLPPVPCWFLCRVIISDLWGRIISSLWGRTTHHRCAFNHIFLKTNTSHHHSWTCTLAVEHTCWKNWNTPTLQLCSHARGHSGDCPEPCNGRGCFPHTHSAANCSQLLPWSLQCSRVSLSYLIFKQGREKSTVLWGASQLSYSWSPTVL